MKLPHFFEKNKKLFVSASLIFIAAGFFIFTAGEIKAQTISSCGSGADSCQGRHGTYKLLAASIPTTPLQNASGQTSSAAQTAQTAQTARNESPGLISGILYKVVIKIIGGVMYLVFWVLSWLLWLAAKLLGFVLNEPQLQKFTGALIVQKGWSLTRDIANMFFALIMLVIAFATILRLESYGYKRILPTLIIAALLINFSLVIAGVIIDFSQTATKFFVDGAKGNYKDVTEPIMKGLGITEGFSSAKIPDVNSDMQGLLNLIIGLFGGIVVILIAAFTFFAAAIFFVVRFVALWFLLILAPLAWIFYILPATKQYWTQWWSTFFKWVLFAPAYTFFLYLAMLIITSGAITQQAGFSSQQLLDFTNTKQNFGGGSLTLIINYIIIIGFLLGALIVAQRTGVVGANAMMGAVKGAGKGIGRMTGRWAARGAPMPKVVSPALRKLGFEKTAQRWEKVMKVAGAPKRAVAPLFVPEVWKRAMAAKRAKSDAASYTKASGRLEGLMGFSPKMARLREEQERDKETARKQKEINDIYQGDENRLIKAWDGAKDSTEKEALLRLIASANGLNTLLQSQGKDFTPGELRNFVQGAFTDKDDAARVASTIGAIGAANKNYSYAGMTKFDTDTGKYKFVKDDDEQADSAAKRAMKDEAQDWARGLHTDTFVQRDKENMGKPKRDQDGNIILNKTGEQIIMNLTQSHTDQANRLKTETLQTLHDAEANIRKLADRAREAGNINQANTINTFMDKVNEKYTGTSAEAKKGGPTIAGGSTQEFNQARGQQPPKAFG